MGFWNDLFGGAHTRQQLDASLALWRAVLGAAQEPDPAEDDPPSENWLSRWRVERDGLVLHAGILVRERRLFSQVEAASDEASGFSLELLPEGVTTTLSKIFSSEDLSDVDGALDRLFFIKTSDPERARAWLEGVTAPLCQLAGYSLLLGEGAISLAREGLEMDEARLRTALDVVFSLVARGRALESAWESLAAALGGRYLRRVEGEDEIPEIEVQLHSGSAWVTTSREFSGWARPAPYTTLRVPLTTARASFCLYREAPPKIENLPAEGAISPRLAPHYKLRVPEVHRGDGLSAAACEAIVRAAPAFVFCDGAQVWVLFEGMLLDPARILAGIEALAQVAGVSPVLAPYR